MLMHASSYRGLRCRLGRLTEVRAIATQQSALPRTAGEGVRQQQSQRRVCVSAHLEARRPSLTAGSKCDGGRRAAATSAAATMPVRRVLCWHQGPEATAAESAVNPTAAVAEPLQPSTPAPTTTTTRTTPPTHSCFCFRSGFGRHMSTATASANRRKGERTSASEVLGKTSPSLLSLQELLGISDEEAETIRRKEQTSKTGFGNLTAAGAGGGDSKARDTDGELAVSHPPPAPQSSPPPCFPRFLLDELCAKPMDVKSLVLRRPVVLGWSAVAAERVSRWLRERLGMSRSEVARVLLKNPEAGTKTVESNIEPKVEWLRDNLELRGANHRRGVVRLLLHAPQILNLSTEKSLEPTLRWLQGRLRVSGERAAKIARENPTLFWLSLENNVEPTLAWLRERLGINDGVILAMVATAPNILSLNTRTGIEPNLAWLRDRLGLSPREVAGIVTREPTILYKSVVDNLEPKLLWLKTNLELDDDAARKMFVAFPRLAGTSLAENLKLTLPWLSDTLGLNAAEAVALVRRAPVLLQYSIKDNLDPTVSFFRLQMGASEEELRASVVRNPKVLAYSLDGRLRPRVAAMRRTKIQPVFSKHLSHVTRWSDSKFASFLDSFRRY